MKMHISLGTLTVPIESGYLYRHSLEKALFWISPCLFIAHILLSIVEQTSSFGTCAGQMERAVKQTTLRLLFGNALPKITFTSRVGAQRLLPQSSAVQPYDDFDFEHSALTNRMGPTAIGFEIAFLRRV